MEIACAGNVSWPAGMRNASQLKNNRERKYMFGHRLFFSASLMAAITRRSSIVLEVFPVWPLNVTDPARLTGKRPAWFPTGLVSPNLLGG
jgi:hypothetical protein